MLDDERTGGAARVLVVGKIHADGLARLEGSGGLTVEELDEADGAALSARLPSADALLIRTAPLPAEAVHRAGRLRVVSRHGVGYDNIPLEALNARGIPLAVIGNVSARAVAEHAIGLLFAVAKCLPRYDAAVRAGDWGARNGFEAIELAGRTLLVLGLGRIGRETAALGRAIGMRVLAFDRSAGEAEMRALGIERRTDWRQALAEADAVTLHLPRTLATEAMIGAAEIARMRPRAILINTARGGLVDEAALAAALSVGHLAGAGIDTFDDEPPASDSPLLVAPRVVLTPHSASLTGDAAARMAIAAADNVIAGLAGRLDPSLVVNAAVLAR